MTSCLDSALCISLFLHTYPYINKAFHLVNTQKFHTCKLMKDHDSRRRSEVFDARGGEPQWLLLTEITNLKKITDICCVYFYLAQEFGIFYRRNLFIYFHVKYPFCSPRWPQQHPPPSPQRSR